MRRQIAYNAAGITHEKIIELMSEIKMYELLVLDAEALGEAITDSHPLMVKRESKRTELHNLLRVKNNIKIQYPIS